MLTVQSTCSNYGYQLYANMMQSHIFATYNCVFKIASAEIMPHMRKVAYFAYLLHISAHIQPNSAHFLYQNGPHVIRKIYAKTSIRKQYALQSKQKSKSSRAPLHSWLSLLHTNPDSINWSHHEFMHLQWNLHKQQYNSSPVAKHSHGHSDGEESWGYIDIYTPQKIQLNFLRGRNDVRTTTEHEY